MSNHFLFDIDSVEDVLGYYLVGCFMGHFHGRLGVVAVGNQSNVAYRFYMHPSGLTIFQFDSIVD